MMGSERDEGYECTLYIKEDRREIRYVVEIFSLPGGLFGILERFQITEQIMFAGQASPEYPKVAKKMINQLLPGATSSDATFGTIKSWLRDCICNHAQCNPTTTSPTKLPTRLLDLRAGQIMLRENIQGPAVYACLSHCWGPVQDIIKTTTTTIEAFKIDIPESSLPKTFKDTVKICRRLRIHFLWIDSLCIIQDSAEDWKKEASRMADIYEHAHLTIAASRAKSSSEGCYTVTSPDMLAQSVTKGVYARKEPPKFPTNRLDRADTILWPTFSRGWIYQEMRLSHRVLHFCSQEVMWECRCCIRSESGCSDMDLVTNSMPGGRYTSIPYMRLSHEPRILWHRYVEEYSQLKFTFIKDRMAAFAGLVQRMEKERPGDRYLSGLWEKTLLQDLLWSTLHSELGRQDDRQTPTWSWASVRTPVTWEDKVDSALPFVEVLNIQYSTTGPSHMADISEARITIRGPLIETTFGGRKLELVRGMPSTRDITITKFCSDYNPQEPGQFKIDFDEKLMVLVIGVSLSDAYYVGLVLRQKQDQETYERVGYAHLEHRGNKSPENVKNRSIATKYPYKRRKLNMEPMDSVLTSIPPSDVTIV